MGDNKLLNWALSELRSENPELEVRITDNFKVFDSHSYTIRLKSESKRLVKFKCCFPALIQVVRLNDLAVTISHEDIQRFFVRKVINSNEN